MVENNSITLDKIADITRGNIIVGGSSNNPQYLDSSGLGKILIGNGTDVQSQSITGDATLNSQGILTINNNSITLDKIADITRGNIIVGGSSNNPQYLDSSGLGKILIGNGTDVQSQNITGDATLNSQGVLTINNNSITLDKIADITRGNIIIGGSNNNPQYLDSSGLGKILIGNGTDVQSQSITGDATLNS